MELKTERYQYRIALETPLGIRKGKLFLSVIGDRLEGTVEILGRQQSCAGERRPDGSCVFSGQLKTLRSVFDYTAAGRFDKNSIVFDLKYPYGVLHATGTRVNG